MPNVVTYMNQSPIYSLLSTFDLYKIKLKKLSFVLTGGTPGRAKLSKCLQFAYKVSQP
jgi:hypothetical protein